MLYSRAHALAVNVDRVSPLPVVVVGNFLFCLVIFFGQVFPLKLQLELRGIHWLWKVTHIWSLESVTEAKRRNCLNFLPFHDCLLIIWIWRVRRCAPPVSLDVTKDRQEKKKKDKASRKALLTKNSDHIDKFKSLRRDVKTLIHNKYTDYLSHLDDWERSKEVLELL